ncbi:hypothetical protein, partial [Teichococcus cervicalis]
RLFLRGAWQEAALYERDALSPGAAFAGPAIVTQADCTILVPPGWQAETDGLRNLLLQRGVAPAAGRRTQAAALAPDLAE